MADIIQERLDKFEASKNEKYDPGNIVIFFDNRLATTEDDKFSIFQSYFTAGLYKLGWPSLYTPDLDPGNIRLVWHTVSRLPCQALKLVQFLYDMDPSECITDCLHRTWAMKATEIIHSTRPTT